MPTFPVPQWLIVVSLGCIVFLVTTFIIRRRRVALTPRQARIGIGCAVAVLLLLVGAFIASLMFMLAAG